MSDSLFVYTEDLQLSKETLAAIQKAGLAPVKVASFAQFRIIQPLPSRKLSSSIVKKSLRALKGGVFGSQKEWLVNSILDELIG